MKIFKRLFLFMLCAVFISGLFGCKSKDEKMEDKRVTEAIEVLSEYWNKTYDEMGVEDKYLEIINVKIVNIKDDIDPEQVDNREALFDDIDYIVEFDLLSNFYNTTPYYSNIGMNNCVAVHKDGTMSAERYSPLLLLRTSAYITDFSEIIESIEDFHGEYDQVLEIK